MKRIFVVLFLLVFSVANAQDSNKSVGKGIKKGAKATGNAIGKGAKKVGNKTAEVASKGKSKIVDKKYEGKAGPNGEIIYIDQYSKYYWVDKKGHRHYVTEVQLKNKVD
jgi:hypothetical protein